jgi:hypothetical protein
MSVQNQPKNMNPASINNFKMVFSKLPTMEFFVTDCNIPSITMGETFQPSYNIDAPLPGDKLSYGELSIEFIVDEELRNWEEIHNWMISIGTPKSPEQYDRAGSLTDATLIIMSNSMNPILEFTFIDVFPTSLGDLQFSNAGNSDTLLGSASFRFRAYDINRV